MYAVIIQSQSPYGIRQVAYVPLLDGSVRTFKRVGQTRGVAGAWSEEPLDAVALSEFVVGHPVAINITPSDYRDLQFPITPTTLMQKLVRAVKEQPYSLSTDTLSDVLDDVVATATSGAHALIKYTKALQPVTVPAYVPTPVVSTPAIQVMHEPVVEQIVIEPVMEVVERAMAEAQPTQTTAPAPAPAQTNAMVTSATALGNPTTAVLSVPEVEPYFERSFDGLSETEIYDYTRSNSMNILLTGEAGTGKTSSARNYAAKRGIPFVTIELTQQIDQSVTQGRFVPTGNGNQLVFMYSQLATIIQGPGVVLLNELTRMAPKAASLFLRLLNERELLIEPLNEVIKVHPDCLIVADQNIGLGYTGTVRQDSALTDRFNIKLEFKYDSKIEGQFIKSPTLLEFANSIRQASELSDEFSIPMSTRLLKNFQSQAKGLSFKFAVSTLLNSFPKNDGEREAIKMRFDTQYEAIAEELGVSLGDYNNK
jgi:hypothetical protein